MKKKKIMDGIIILVLLVIGGYWLLNNGTNDKELSRDKNPINVSANKTSQVSQKASDVDETVMDETDIDGLAAGEENGMENADISLENDEITNTDVVTIQEPKIEQLNLLSPNLHINQYYDNSRYDQRQIYDFREVDDNKDDIDESLNDAHSSSLIIATTVNLYTGNGTQKNWSIDDINNNIDSDHQYDYVVSKDAKQMYCFYTKDFKSYADIYKTSLSSDNLIDFTYSKTVKFDQKFNQIYSMDNLIIFKFPTLQYTYLIVTDLECTPITGVKFDSELVLLDVTFRMDSESLMYNLFAEKDGQDISYEDYFYYGSYEGNHCLVVEDQILSNGLPIEEYLVKSDDQGNHYYLNTLSYELITLDKDYKITDITEIPPIILKKEEYEYLNFYLSYDFWGILKKGILFKNLNDIYYYEFSSKKFITVDSTYSQPVRYSNREAYILNNDNYREDENHLYFDEEQMKFVSVGGSYLEYEKTSWIGDYYVFDDIMYYYDSLFIVNQPRENGGDPNIMRPVSLMPDITYKGKPIFMTSSMKVNNIEYVRTTLEGLLGTVDKDEFTPIINKSVNRYDCSDKGIVYTTHDQSKAAYYLDLKTNQTFELAVDVKPLDVQLIKSYVYVLDENNKIHRFNISTLTGTRLVSDKTIIPSELHDKVNEEAMEYTENERYTRLDDNNEYLVFIDQASRLSLILDQDLNLYDLLTGECKFITEDGYIYYNVIVYYSRYNIKTKKDTIIHLSYARPTLFYNGNILFNSAYEGPGSTYIKSLYDEEGEFFQEDVDYSIEIAMIHSTQIIIYDHVDQQLDLIIGSGRNINYEVTEEGFWYWIDDKANKKLYPLRKNSKIEVYKEKRT